MNIEILDVGYDNVIKSKCIMAKVDYRYAIEKLVPLRNRFDSQRYTLKSKLYKKLERDIENGCIMPPITIGINSITNSEVDKSLNKEDAKNIIENNIENAFILDGIQRLNVLKNIENKIAKLEGTLYLNIIVSNSMDRLLYRMITLNNGQKPMSPRHQIEVLAGKIYDFENLGLTIQTEKDQKIINKKIGFKKEDIIKAYISFISESTNIDNQKIIDSKLDELITEKIIDSSINERDVEFRDVVGIISRFSENEKLYTWFKISNNLIGFSAGINKSYYDLKNESIEEFMNNVHKIEDAISYLDISKIKLSSARRNTVKYFIENYYEIKCLDTGDIADRISVEI